MKTAFMSFVSNEYFPHHLTPSTMGRSDSLSKCHFVDVDAAVGVVVAESHRRNRAGGDFSRANRPDPSGAENLPPRDITFDEV